MTMHNLCQWRPPLHVVVHRGNQLTAPRITEYPHIVVPTVTPIDARGSTIITEAFSTIEASKQAGGCGGDGGQEKGPHQPNANSICHNNSRGCWNRSKKFKFYLSVQTTPQTQSKVPTYMHTTHAAPHCMYCTVYTPPFITAVLV